MRRSALSAALVIAVVAAIGVLLREPCAAQSWGSSVEVYTRLCYSDVGPLYFVRGLADGVVPYLQSYQDQYLEYPVLIGLWMYLTNLIVQTLHLQPAVGWFVHLTWLVSIGLISASAFLMSRIRGMWREVWWYALSPAVLLVTGVNWDALAVLSTIAALHQYQRGNRGWAGFWIGIGTATKLYPALLLIPMLANLSRGRWPRKASRLLGTSLLTWLIINLPVALASPNGWLEFYKFSRERGIDVGSIWLAANTLLHANIELHTVNTIGLAVVGIAGLLLLLAGKRVDVFTGSLAIVGVFVLVNKVYSPQYWLWLTPLMVMAAVRFREYALWSLAQLIYFIAIWRFLLFYLDPKAAGALSWQPYAWVIVLQWTATLAVVVSALVRSSRRRGRLRS